MTMPAFSTPKTAREYQRAAAAERHAAAEHRKVCAELSSNLAEMIEGTDEHEGLAGAVAVHKRAAEAHESLAAVYDRGDVMDPHDLQKALEAAGRRIPLRNDKDEAIVDETVERERHKWLLRRGKTLDSCKCSECDRRREAERIAEEGRARMASVAASRRAASRPS